MTELTFNDQQVRTLFLFLQALGLARSHNIPYVFIDNGCDIDAFGGNDY